MGRDGRYMVRSGGLYRLFRKQANCLSPFREGTEQVNSTFRLKVNDE